MGEDGAFAFVQYQEFSCGWVDAARSSGGELPMDGAHAHTSPWRPGGMSLICPRSCARNEVGEQNREVGFKTKLEAVMLKM